MIPDKFKKLIEDLKSKLEVGLPEDVDVSRGKGEEVKWSKGPSFSIMPYGLELAGVTPAPLLDSEPKSKKNCFKFYCSEAGEFYKSDIYGVSSTIVETEIYQAEDQWAYSVRFDDDGEAIRASAVMLEDGAPFLSCRLEEDGEYWCYEYRYEAGRIVSMVSYASNGVPGTEIFLERNGESLIGLYFFNKESRVYVYKV